jgi:hypothetical protein
VTASHPWPLTPIDLERRGNNDLGPQSFYVIFLVCNRCLFCVGYIYERLSHFVRFMIMSQCEMSVDYINGPTDAIENAGLVILTCHLALA